MNFENILITGLMKDERLIRQVYPYLKKEYFEDRAHQTLYLIISSYFKKYSRCASIEVLNVELEKLRGVNESLYAETVSKIESIKHEEYTADVEWMLTATEEYIQERSLHLALTKAIEIYQGNDKNLTKTSIPKLLSDALAVGFDHRMGHDFIDDTENQLDFYHDELLRIPFDVDILNQITNGGIPRKTYSLFVAGCVEENTEIKVRITKL